MINTIKVIIYIIMYTYSIAITSSLGDDGITAQLLHCFKSYLIGLLRRIYYTPKLYIFQELLQKRCLEWQIKFLLRSSRSVSSFARPGRKQWRLLCNLHLISRHPATASPQGEAFMAPVYTRRMTMEETAERRGKSTTFREGKAAYKAKRQ